MFVLNPDSPKALIAVFQMDSRASIFMTSHANFKRMTSLFVMMSFGHLPVAMLQGFPVREETQHQKKTYLPETQHQKKPNNNFKKNYLPVPDRASITMATSSWVPLTRFLIQFLAISAANNQYNNQRCMQSIHKIK